MFQIGLAKKDITPAPKGEFMMGWGEFTQRANSVGAPLHARAMVLKGDSGDWFYLVCLEICFVTQAVRDGVLKSLNERAPDQHYFTEENVLVCATHTHCAPGGHAHDVLYSLPSFGWYPHIVEKYSVGAADAILEALEKTVPGKIRFAEEKIPEDQPVAFNRSLNAWNQNPDVTQFEEKDWHQALDRTMSLFRFEDLNGKFIGCLNDFSVHCTSVHRDHPMIHSDNKGLAATQLENELGGVCIFTQGAAGDVSPNFKYYPGLKDIRGTNRDDLISAHDNAKIQSTMASRLVALAAKAEPISSEVDSVLEYADLSAVRVDPQDVGGLTNCETGPSVIGATALRGTAEGMPTPAFLFYFMLAVSRTVDFASFVFQTLQLKKSYLWNHNAIHARKVACIQAGESELFKSTRVALSFIPSFFDPLVSQYKTWDKKGILKERPFTPQILPIQIIRIGNWAWVAVPAEFTTTSGKRLKDSVLNEVKQSGITKVMLVGYSNAYAGYVTTPEEYQVQRYEGSSTHFGLWTQPAYQTLFRKLARRFLVPKAQRLKLSELRPPQATKEFLEILKSKAH